MNVSLVIEMEIFIETEYLKLTIYELVAVSHKIYL